MNNNKYELIERINSLKEKVASGNTTSYEWRIEQIKRIDLLLEENKSRIINALFSDLGKSKVEALSEILLVKEEINLFRRELQKWMKPRLINTPIYLFPSSSSIIYEPLGCVLILGPYNYPLLYILKPLVNIFAAGNTAIIKPSEKCIQTSKLIKDLTKKYFESDTLITVEGGYEEAVTLANQDFDHIFFTGSSKTGKSIMKSAAKNLTPVTLELSGTNPVIVFKNTNLKITAKRLVWGKFLNSGQSCMAPNHIFVDESIKDDLIREIKNSIIEFYGKDPLKSKDLSKLEEKNFIRSLSILKKAKNKDQIIYGGDFNEKQFKISPTILEIEKGKDSLIKEELFSSILPILVFNDVESILKLIQKSPKPLAIYIFGGNKILHKRISEMTSSGSICINDVIIPVITSNLPFGGVGKSGIGKFHGEEGFKNFSNQKSITRRGTFLDVVLRYPPYARITNIMNFIFKI